MLFIAAGRSPLAPWVVLAIAAGAALLVAAIAHPALGIGLSLMIAAGLYVPRRMRLGGTRPITALTPRTSSAIG